MFGTATTATLLSLLAATQLDAVPGWMGVLAAASWSPWLILGLPAGALVDRWSPRTTMIVRDLVAVDAEQLGTANSRLYATESASTVVGPGLAGLIAQAVSAALGVLLDAASAASSAGSSAHMSPAGSVPRAARSRCSSSAAVACWYC
ncbi:hypothetical protein GCM10029963_75670 [Micromonospora andamanensis]|uniref:hypothetical protein n=1 Tax=Micromonospora andamanensis TaxID=1287068 RepID=UPI001951CAF7|nr:hypothetical protein [Micromonospora andamanensis]GIJ41168.1 hypothetical protein Vwe01_44930 [Micromonospora andamanensis]